MSVINDMLRDLEERNAPEREALAGSSRSLVATVEPSFWARNKLALSLGLLVLLLGLTLAWVLLAPKASELSVADAMPASSQPNQSAPVLSEPVLSEPELSEPELSEPELSEPELPGQASNLATQPKPGMAAQDLAEQPKLKEPKAKLKPKAEQSAKAKQVAASTERPVQAQQDAKPVPVTRPKQVAKPLQSKKTQQQADTSLQNKVLPKAQATQPVAVRASVEAENSQGQVLSKQSSLPVHAASDLPLDDVPQTLDVPMPEVTVPRNEVKLTPQALDQAEAERIRKLYSAGERQSAEQAAYAFITTREQHEQTQLVLATQLLAQQSLAPLAALLAEVDADSLPALRMVKARWFAQGDQLALGANLLSQNLPAVAEHADYHALLASYYQQLGRYESAVERYSSLLESDPNQAPWWLGMAISLDRLARYEDAALAYRQALALPTIAASLAQFARQRLAQLNATGTL